MTGLGQLPALGINTITTEGDVWSHSKNAPAWLQDLQGPLDWAAGPGKSTIDT